MRQQETESRAQELPIWFGPTITAEAEYKSFDYGSIRRASTAEEARVAGKFLRPAAIWPERFVPAPDVARASQVRGLEWATRFGLARDPKALQKLDSYRYGYLFHYAVETSVSDAARDLMTDLMTWFFFVDDIADEGYDAGDMSVEEIHRVLGVLAGILDGDYGSETQVPDLRYRNAEYGEIYRGIVGATFDILARVRALGADPTPFARDLATWVRSVAVELHYHVHRLALSEHSYLGLRKLTIGVSPTYEMAAIVNGVQDRYDQLRGPLNRFKDLAISLVALTNDVASIVKELNTRDDDFIFNVITIRHRAFLNQATIANPLQTAVDSVVDLINDETARLVSLLSDDELVALFRGRHGAPLREEDRTIVAMLFNGVISDLEWHLAVPRYRSAPKPAPRPELSRRS